MKILPLLGFNNNTATSTPLSNRYVTQSPKYAHTLDRDTVSFTGGEKVLTTEVMQISTRQVRRLRKEAEGAANKLRFILKKYLDKYVATSNNPDNMICAGNKGIKVRVKDEFSTIQKATARSLKTDKDIREMGDFIGARIILREGTEKNVDKIISELCKAVEQGDLRIIEIENYKLPSGRAYSSAGALNKLEKICLKKGFVSRKEKSIESGYTAIHIGVKLPDGYIGEIQIMGRDVEQLKEIEDVIYKLRCKKELPKKYSSLKKPLTDAINSIPENYKENYMQYIRDSYIHARELEPVPLTARKRSDFLPIPYFLPQELGFENLQKTIEVLNIIAARTNK